MTDKKESVTAGNSDGIHIENYAGLQFIFLRYCESKQLNIREANDLLDCLKNDLQNQVCHVATRKEFDEIGNVIKYC